jgi:hypothetical protein
MSVSKRKWLRLNTISKAKGILWSLAFVSLSCAVILLALTYRYPNMTLDQSSTYVLQRMRSMIFEFVRTRTPYDNQESLEVELENIRRIILHMNPDLVSKKKMDIAIAIRNMVYSNVPLKPPPALFSYVDLDRAVYLELLDSNYGDICGGLTIIYMAALKAFGIRSRYVGLFKEVVNVPDPVVSHATVEVQIDGKWVAEDPTFNFSIFSGGRRIGWEEARDLVLSGHPITFQSDGYPLLPGRSVYEYPDPLTEALQFMIFSPIGGEGESLADVKTVPDVWDGKILYSDGRVFDQREILMEDPLYVKLGR